MFNGMLELMYGMPVISSPHLPRFKIVQFRFPRSKGKRIRAKFTKCKDNFKQVKFHTAFVLSGNKMIIHPDDFERLQVQKGGI